MNNNEYKPRHASGVFKPWFNKPRSGVFIAVFTILALLTATVSLLNDESMHQTLFQLGLALLSAIGVCWVISDNRK